MRKVLTIAVAALLVVAFVGAANAANSSTAWRFNIKADNGFGGESGSNAQLGIATQATDGLDTAAATDQEANMPLDTPGTGRFVTTTIPGGTAGMSYKSNIQSTKSPYDYPGQHKVWDLYIAAGPNANTDPVTTYGIRLQFIATTQTPLATDAAGRPIFFELKMIDNKGKAGAPTNGTKWMIPVPVSAVNQSVFWNTDTALDTNGVAWGALPILKASNTGHQAWIDQGYQMQFRVVPEPSSMLALGSGLAGLVGFAIRRRRA